MKPLILSLPEHLALKNDEERERRITEVVEKMSDETFGTRLVLFCFFYCVFFSPLMFCFIFLL